MKTASLSSTLLVRKGAAAPSSYAAPSPAALDSVTAMSPIRPIMNGRHPHGSDTYTAPQIAAPPPPRKQPRKQALDHNGRVRLSVRFDQDQHTKLQLASVHTKRSMRDLIATAVDSYLRQIAPNVRHGACACLARNNAQNENG